MAITADSITDNTSTVPENSEPAPQEAESSAPAEVLELPIVRGLLDGSSPAIYNPSGSKSEEIDVVLKNGKALREIGINFFHDEKAKLDLAYNTQFVSPEMVKEAAKKGKLKEISQSYAEVSARINAAIGGPAAGGAAPMGGDTSMNLPNTPVNTARISNLSLGSPSEGAKPGQGRLINSLLKPVI